MSAQSVKYGEVICGGIPRDIDEMNLISNEGLVIRLIVVRNMQTRISKGYAFVDMRDRTGADRASQALNGLVNGD